MSDLYVVRRRRCWWELPSAMEEPYAVAVFRTAAAATEEAVRRSQSFLSARLPKASPFTGDHLCTPEEAYLGWPRVTSLPPFALRDWMLDAGFPDTGPHALPTEELDDLAVWNEWCHRLFEGEKVYDDGWRKVIREIPPYWISRDQHRRFWEAMNLFPVYEVAGVDWHAAMGNGGER